jgi:hypothetical protein
MNWATWKAVAPTECAATLAASREFSLAQDDDRLLENYCTNKRNAAHVRKLAE